MSNSPYRILQKSLLTSPDFEDWSYEEISFYVLLIISPFTGLSGILNVSKRLLAATFRLTTEQVSSLLDSLEKRGKIIQEGNIIWLKEFIRQQNISGDALLHAAKELESLGNDSTIYSAAQEIYPELFEKLSQRRKKTSSSSQPPVDPRLTPGEPPVDPRLTLGQPNRTGTGIRTGTGNNNNNNIEHSSYEECLSSQDCEDASENILKVPKTDKTPYQQIIDMYHSICVDLPRVKVLNETRKRLVRARWRQYPDFRFWESFFKRVHESDFLNGRLALRDDKPPFIADFEWLVRPNNFAKILEGKYDNRKTAKEIEEEEYYEQIRRKLGI